MANLRPVDKLIAQASELIQNKLSTLEDMWREMYSLDDALMEKYCTGILSLMTKLFEDLEENVIDKRTQLVTDIEEKLRELNQLQRELNVTIRAHYNDDDPFQEILGTLNKNLEGYRVLRGERVKRLTGLREQERRLCELLTEPTMEITEEVPSEEQLDNLEARCVQLQQIKVTRQSIFNDVKSKVSVLVRQLELTPTLAFERDFLESGSEPILLTPNIMVQINEVMAKYERLFEEASEHCNLLKDALARLWDQIDVTQPEREEFLGSLNGIGNSAREAISAEISRCEKIRRDNIEPIVGRLRTEIARLWELLTYTDDKKRQFEAYSTDLLNEDVLALHEIEKLHLEQEYNANRHIYEMAEKRQQLQQRVSHLIEQMNNPNRLKNRGGQLLKEERERKALEKNLPTIDSQLKRSLVSYYERNGTPFLWHGEDLLQKIQNSRDSVRCTTPKVNSRVNPRRCGSTQSLMTDSVATYSQFQEDIESGSSNQTATFNRLTPQTKGPSKFHTPTTRSASRLPLRRIQPTPPTNRKRAHSSPTTPKRLTPFKSRRIASQATLLSGSKNSLYF